MHLSTPYHLYPKKTLHSHLSLLQLALFLHFAQGRCAWVVVCCLHTLDPQSNPHTHTIYIYKHRAMEERKPPMRSNSGGGGGLDSFMAHAAPKARISRGSATVSGPFSSKSAPADGEVYIRADGKKVRRVRKTVPKASEGLGNFLQESAPTRSTGMSGSATVTGYRATKSADDGEVYIRPDGKKVRRVKRTVAKDDSLGGFLDAGATAKPRMSGSATVTGYTPSKVNSKLTASAASKSQDDGEVYIRADGKKVRRVRKTVPKTTDERQTEATPTTKDPLTAEERKKKNLAKFLDNAEKKAGPKKKKGSSYSVSGGETKKDLGNFLGKNASGKKTTGGSASVSGLPTGGVKLSKSAEDFAAKYRKKKKPAKSSDDENTASSGDDKPKNNNNKLGGFLEAGATPKSKLSGSATVTGYNPTKSAGSKEEGEIYIRADGKKVRRVRRVVHKEEDNEAPAEAKKAGLGGFLGAHTTPKSKMSGSATVTGYNPSKAAKSVGSKEEGEIYIRADGKKVRRIRKSKSTDDAEPAAKLGNFLGTQKSLAKPMSGAATVTGASLSKKSVEEGEIYINKDGKKVRRVRKNAATAAGDAAKTDNTALSGFLGASTPAKSKMSGSATVTGYNPSKSSGKLSSSSVGEGEIYIRADGKKVRRVRKSKATDDAAPPAASDAKPKNGGAATVAGEKVIKVTPEGEIVLRADGKKVLRRKKNATASTTTAESDNSEVYRRADGKLVRRVRKGPKTTSSAAGDLAGFLGTSNSNKARPDGEIATVSGDFRSKTSLEDLSKFKKTDSPPKPLPELDPNVDFSKLTAEQFAIAGSYRIMLQQGLTPDQVHSRMEQDGVDKVIVSAVLQEDRKQSPRRRASMMGTMPASNLPPEEDSIAEKYRKMLKLGMPDDAVRSKMTIDGVAEHIIADVLGEENPAASSSTSPDGGVGVDPVSNLSAEDEALAATYRKMLKMGLPADAVRHKMVQDGVNNDVIAAVLGKDAVETSEPTAATTTDGKENEPKSGLSADDEAIASRFKKMLKMGLPEDAVRNKMTLEGVEERIIQYVFGGAEEEAPAPLPAPAPPAVVSNLSPEDEEIATKYRKMFKMGLPEDAVKHKMTQDGVADHIVASVMGGDETGTSSAPESSSTPVENGKYTVVMGPDHSPSVPSAGPVTPLDPNEKFAVDVDAEQKIDGEVETRFMTLEDIAKATGQAPEQLKEMVQARRSSSSTMPRFVLTPTHPKPAGDVFEVAVPKTAVAAAVSSQGGPTMRDAGLDPKKHYSEVKEGEEVVDAKLADAARAVSALGDMDMKSLLEQLKHGEMNALLSKLQEAEKRQKKLEKQLAQAGVAIAEDIDYGEALQKVAQIAKRMGEIGGSDVTHEDKDEQNRLREEYFKLEQEMERYNTALMLTDEYQKEQDRLEQKWEDDNREDNLEALKKIRRHMPVKIRHLSEAQLTSTMSPNGKFLPKAIAKKFKRTNVLQAIRINPDDLERMHPSTLENMRVTGLTLTERRALYAHLKPLGPRWEKNKAEKMTERKWTWYKMMKSNFKENLAPYQRHVEQYGPPDNHVGCPLLGKQCPIKADKMIDYDNDYGWPDGDEYEVSDVKKADVDDPGAKAKAEALELAKEKKANERADLLKKHYKGKLLQVSKANGSCEAMDETMDKMEFGLENWIEFKIDKKDNLAEADKKKEVANFTEGLNTLKLAILDFAQRSGMQTSGKKKAGGDGEDIRSSVEASLAEEVWETSQVYFKYIRARMKELEMRDTRVEKTIELLEKMLAELHGKNEALLKKLGVPRRERSRELKEASKIQREIEEKIKAKTDAEKPPAAEEMGGGPPGSPGGGRGGLLDAIAGGGRGRGRGPPGGRGGLLDAIAGRGRGRGGRGPPGGRGGLLDAIAARGRGRGDGGRGGLMAAIAARGRGG